MKSSYCSESENDDQVYNMKESIPPKKEKSDTSNTSQYYGSIACSPLVDTLEEDQHIQLIENFAFLFRTTTLTKTNEITFSQYIMTYRSI